MGRGGAAREPQAGVTATPMMREMIRTRLALAPLVVLALAIGPASAQTYPDKPIRLIVPFPPGGPTDFMARLIAQYLSAHLGQIVIDNRPGAGGTIATKAVASAEPDGYTLLYGSSATLGIAPALYRNADYDPVRSFAPVALVSSVPFVLVVAPSVPASTLAEFIAYAKVHPGELNFGAAVGTPPHLVGELFKVVTGTDIVFVPYKGAAASMTDCSGARCR
jgi:tripartite-type tricarboxylate transporter receptor subunit TctC